MNKENLKYCLYFKGEQECPEGDYETFQRFWYMESEYYAPNDFDSRNEIWKGFAERAMKEEGAFADFLKDKRWNETQRAFITYAAMMPPGLPPTYMLAYGSK